MKSQSILSKLFFICLALLSTISTAETRGGISMTESSPLDEIWVNAGFYTYHFQKNRNLNDNNPGFGGEYRYTTTSSFVLGQFHNSDWKISDYAGWYWRPLNIGPVGLGAEIGAINGYPKFSNGGWFPVLAPVVSYEYKSVGANLIIIPNYKEQLHGGISVQFKIKL